MPYYHVCLTYDDHYESGETYTNYVFELDMSESDVLTLSKQYAEGKRVLVEGDWIDCKLIRKMLVFRTPRRSEAYGRYKRFEVKRGDAPSRIFGLGDQKAEGEDVTREILAVPVHDEKKQKADELSSENIFIVHGRDHKPMKELKEMLYDFGLNPVVLHEQPSASRTVVEKLEKYSDVGYALVILTPDDVGCLYTRGLKQVFRNELISSIDWYQMAEGMTGQEMPTPDDMSDEIFEGRMKKRARQNVVLEFGYFMGMLGRERVCCLYKGDVELPSDMHGIVYIPFKDSVNKVRNKIMKELQAAGYEIKA